MKAKDYAVSLGLANAGRGRMSREAHAAIQKAIENGMTFTDYRGTPAAKGTVVATVKTAKPETDDGPVDAVVNPYAEAYFRYPQDQMFAYEDDNGRTHTCTGRAACMTCGYSLVGHTCNNPVVLTKHGQRTVRPKGE